MKKITQTFVTFVALLLATLACQKDQQGSVSPQASDRVDIKRIGAVRDLVESERKDAYLKLNADEKEYVWDKQPAGLYSRVGDTTQQKEFLLKFMNATTPDLFSDKKQEPELAVFEDYWNKEAIKYFTRDDLLGVVAKIQGNGTNSLNGSSRVEGGCGCKVDNLWACSTCSYGGCEVTSGGCGIFFLRDCNGGCEIKPEQT